MAKQKIIKSEDLKLLKIGIVNDIDEARNQAKVYLDEEQQQARTKGDKIIIENAKNSQKFWTLHGDILHGCLIRIEKYTSEIEI